MQETQKFTEGRASNGIFYRCFGFDNPGVPLIMVMGYGGCMFAWPMEFIEKLAKKTPIVLFDNRGTGRSEAIADGVELRMHHFAEDLQGLVAYLKLTKVNLFGYSMGGCVALEFARLFPELLDKIILQSTTAGGSLYTGSDPDVKDRLANPRGSNFDEMLFDFFDLSMQEAGVTKHRTVLDAICANARQFPTPLAVLIPQLMAFRYFDASKFLDQIDKETLILHGNSDRILKVENGTSLANALKNCQSEFLENCGHCPHIENEEFVLAKITSFLQ